MPPKKNPETQAEQSARFKKDARKLVKASELSLTDANTALDSLVSNAKVMRSTCDDKAPQASGPPTDS